MRYLELFESYNKDEYYKRVEQSHINDFNDFTSTKFSRDLIYKISKLLDDNKIIYKFDSSFGEKTWPLLWHEGGSYNREFLNIRYDVNGIKYRFNIFISDDEWFLAIFTKDSDSTVFSQRIVPLPPLPEYYKCDQFEGLIQLLKDKKCIIDRKPNVIKRFYNYLTKK